jgi:putative peptidoglycan lipid II flippase
MIVRATALNSACVILLGLVTFARDSLISASFGISATTDSFFMALLFPTLATSILLTLSGSALVPSYIRIRQHAAQREVAEFLETIAGINLILILAVLLLATLLLNAAGWIAGLDGIAWTRETMALFYVLALLPVCAAASSTWIAALNGNHRYLATAVAPILPPALACILLLTLGDRFGIFAVAGGVALGSVLQLPLLAVATTGPTALGVPLLPRRIRLTKNVRATMSQYSPLALGALFSSGMLAVDQVMAAALEPGGISALTFGMRVTNFMLLAISGGIGPVLVPHFASVHALTSRVDLRRSLNRVSLLLLGPSVACAMLVCWFSADIISLVFEHGSFSADDTREVSQIQVLYALQIPAYVLSLVHARALSALHRNDILLRIAAANFVLNIALNFLLGRYLGVPGIALSTSIVYIVALVPMRFGVERALMRDRAYPPK